MCVWGGWIHISVGGGGEMWGGTWGQDFGEGGGNVWINVWEFGAGFGEGVRAVEGEVLQLMRGGGECKGQVPIHT